MNTLSHPTSKPWYREPWPWFLMSLPAVAVIAGITTVWLAVRSSDGLVVGAEVKNTTSGTLASLPVLPASKWHAQLTDAASTWRLSGVLHTPFSQPATLTTDAESTVQSKGD